MKANEQIIGSGEIHTNYIIEDMAGLPVEISVSESYTTESVYVKYRRTDGKALPLECDNLGTVTVRFSNHDCNGTVFGDYVLGDLRKGNRNEVLYRLGFITMEKEPVYCKCIPTAVVRKSKISSLPVAPVTLAELKEMPEGTDLSAMQGMYLKDTTNTIISGTFIGKKIIGMKKVYGTQIKI